MQEALHSIYLRLDVNMQYLASKAIAQIIIKILYSNGGSMTAKEIKNELARANDGNRFDDGEVDEILTGLTPNELKKRDGRYYLSTNRKKKLQESVEESEKRLDYILQKYFAGLNSDEASVKDWLSIITRIFFESFSSEWISDLRANTHHISQSAESIRSQVTLRTESIKGIDCEDKKALPSRFFDFVNCHDPEVEAYLWGYGTSAFASKLIRNKHGVDKLTMEAFRDSVCVFDTNVLLFIALENKYAGSFKALEKVFADLNIQPKYFFITKVEYNNKVLSQRNVTLSNYDKFGYDTISKSKDDFTIQALRLCCKDRDDFEKFFDVTMSLPDRIYDKLHIQLLDNDRELSDAIQQAQQNEELKLKLNEKYKAVVGHDKSQSACLHDIGLLEGVRFLRNQACGESHKFFILSDEISVNQYSKGLGTKENLPLALRVDTLINMLAVNNGGDTFDASDYKALFANIIRMGLIPHKDTFDQVELYQLSQINTRISELPSEKVCDIAMQMHRRMMDGEADQDLARELNILVANGELQVKDELRDVRAELNYQGQRNQEMSEDLRIARDAVRKQVENDYDDDTKKQVRKWWIGIVAFVLLLVAGIVYLVYNNSKEVTSLSGTVILGIVSSAIVSIFAGSFTQRRLMKNRNECREKAIIAETLLRLKK